MQSFHEIIAERKLTKESSFSDLAQAAIHGYYLPPYPDPDQKSSEGVNRPHHGGVHVSSTALNVEMLFQLYKKYKPEKLKHPVSGRDLTEKDLELLKLAAIYHDSANTSEAIGDEMAHATNFRRDMVALGWTAEEVEPFAMAIQEKDGKGGKKKAKTVADDRNILQKLLGDADCLDIIRVVHEDFNKDSLAIRKDLRACPGFIEEMDAIIENHFKTISQLEADPPSGSKVGQLHIRCETAENCYLAVRRAEEDMLLSHIVFSCLKQGKVISLSDIDLSELSILDWYNREKSLAVKNLISKLVATPAPEAREKSISFSQDLFEQGCLVRALRAPEIDNEFDALKKNISSLKAVGITTPEQLQEYLKKQVERGERFIHTPSGFKWRPCSYYQSGLRIKFYSEEGIAVIIDPAPDKGTQLSYFYKENVVSSKAATGAFEYNPQKGSRKNKQTLLGLREKSWEKEHRRRGLKADAGHHYFGQDALPWSEVLGTYEEKGIAGIMVGTREQDARDALLLRAKLGEPYRPFYRYTPEAGISLLSEETVITQSAIRSFGVISKTKVDQLVDNINEAATGIFSISGLEMKERDFGEDYGELTVVRRVISYKPSADDRDQAGIYKAMQQLKSLAPRNIQSDMDISDVQVTETGDGIAVMIEILPNASNVESEKAKKQVSDIFIKILGNIQNAVAAVAVISGAPEQPGAFLDTLKMDEIAEIKCISTEPLKFEFKHVHHPEINCTAFVNAAGTPVISFMAEGKDAVEKPSKLLPEITKLYDHKQIAELNALLQSDEMKTLLKALGVEKISAQPGFSRKSYIEWKIEVSSGKDVAAVQADFIARLTSPLLFKKASNIRVKEQVVELSTPYIQHNDPASLIRRAFSVEAKAEAEVKVESEASADVTSLSSSTPRL